MNQVGSSWSALLWFFAIIAMIPLVLWLFKRSPLGGGALGSAGAPRTVAVLPLSAQQKLVTVEVGQGEERLWLVLGVTAQGIRTLHTMAAQTPAAPAERGTAASPPAAFAQLLGRWRGDTGSDHAK